MSHPGNHTGPQPPKLPLQFLRWFCREDFLDEIEGNLLEIFEKESLNNPTKARRQFIINVMRHFRFEYIKVFHNTNHSTSFLPAMIANYIKLALRNLRRKPTFSFINIFGLALGICAALLILNYIEFETSYDNFHANVDQLYRINRTYSQNGEKYQTNIVTSYGLGPKLADEIPSIKNYIRTYDIYGIVSYQPSKGAPVSFREKNGLFADSTFFDAFTFKPLMGDLKTSLDNPNSIVLTETMWHKLFRYEDPIGKTLKFSSGYPNEQFTVTAVIEDVPANSHFNFHFVLPIHDVLASDQYKKDDGWGWNNFFTYIQLDDPKNYYAAEGALPEFAKRWMDPRWVSSNGHVDLHLQPLQNIHTEPGLKNDGETIGRSTIYFFGLIAAFILFIAWINYINLSTARSIERSKEVGIKKAIGAVRTELITQFLFESMVVNLIAIILAVVFAALLLPVLNNIIGKQLPLHLNDIRFWGVLGVLFIIGTFSAGIYPALVLSSFRITKAIKKADDRGFSLRKSLVVFQFVSSIVLIAGTFVVYKQITFMQSRDIGLQTDQMLIIDTSYGDPSWDNAQKKVGVFTREIRNIAGVESVASSGAVPSTEHNWGVDIRKVGEPESSITPVSVIYIDPDFISTYNIQLLSGHNFDRALTSDMNAVIVNEAALKPLKLGTEDDALTEKLILNDTTNIVGVAKNFNWKSLKSDITPIVFKAIDIFPYYVSVRLKGGSIPSTIEAIEKSYRAMTGDAPFEYKFLDDTFNSQYQADQQFGKIFGMFAALAIAICCLGLWGLASFTTSQKLKEIGIRKILGASVQSIAYLLVRQFLLLIGISAVIAIPLAYYGMDTWLGGFAFKIGVGWELFLVPIGVLTAVAMTTIGFQVRRGAVMNPVDVLRTE